jgi:hypothetical protein
LFLVEGSQPFDRLHTTLTVVIATYFSGGITAGAVVGAMRRNTRNRFVAILVGIIAAFCVFLGIAVASDGLPNRWKGASWASLVVCSLLFGIFGGNMFWNNPLD